MDAVEKRGVLIKVPARLMCVYHRGFCSRESEPHSARVCSSGFVNTQVVHTVTDAE